MKVMEGDGAGRLPTHIHAWPCVFVGVLGLLLLCLQDSVLFFITTKDKSENIQTYLLKNINTTR